MMVPSLHAVAALAAMTGLWRARELASFAVSELIVVRLLIDRISSKHGALLVFKIKALGLILLGLVGSMVR